MEKIMQIEIEKIIRTNRKTISLQITDNASLIVRAPYNATKETIENVVVKHLDWIEKKKNNILTRDPKFVKKEFVNGEGFLYLGKSYKLKIINNQGKPLIFQDNYFFVSKEYQATARELFIGWYKKKAYEKISERVEWYAKKRGFVYNKINITNANKMWASCSAKGNLNFSWRLIMAPLAVIDYVVVHELVHLEEKNHAKTFWNKVKMLMPDYEKHKEWLKRNGYILEL
jgi:predicted metal-dependent hydrolase